MEDSRRDLQNDDLNSLLPDVQVDRRGFVAACIAASFAVTAEPLLAQAIKTSMDGLEGGDAKVGDIPVYWAAPKGKGKRPVILVIPEIWGLHEYQKDICRRLAKAGYFGVSLDPTFRIGDLKTVTEIKQSVAMLATEQVEISFAPDAIDAIARIAVEVNSTVENIGARRLQTVIERILDEISFTATDRGGEKVEIDAAYVEARIGDLARNADLSRFIL